MSIYVLNMQKNLLQKACHDLEPILYIILYMFTMYKGPGLKWTPEELEAMQPFAIGSWFMCQPFHSLAKHKAGQLQQFKTKIVTKFSPYFVELGPCMISLLKAIFLSNNFYECLATHDTMLKILIMVLAQLTDEEPCASNPGPIDGKLQVSSHSTWVSMKLWQKRSSRVVEDSGFESGMGNKSSQPTRVSVRLQQKRSKLDSTHT